MLNPLTNLVEAFTSAGKGDFDIKLKEGNDELGKVNTSFNEMMGLLIFLSLLRFRQLIHKSKMQCKLKIYKYKTA